MRIEHDAVVGLPLDDAWRRVIDLAHAASCLPGARIDAVVDGECRGALSVGGAHYTGTVRFLERDDVDHRAVVEVRGRQGDGAAAATVTAALRADGTGTRVALTADIVVSGAAAHADSGAFAEAGTRLLASLAEGLEATNAPAAPTDGVVERPATAPEPRDDPRHDVDDVTVVPLLRRAAVPVAGAVVAGVLGWYLGRHGRRS